VATHAYAFATTQPGLQAALDGGFIGPDKVRYVGPTLGKPNLLGEPTYSSTKEGRVFTFDHIRDQDWSILYAASGGDGMPFAWGYVRAKKWGVSGSIDEWYDWYALLVRPTQGEDWRSSRAGLVLEVKFMQNPVAVA
jgi:hypothetical protein